MTATDWVKWGLTEEVVATISRATPDLKLGITLSTFEDEIPHPRVTAVQAGGAVAFSGKVLVNDVIVKVNGTEVAVDSEASDIIKASKGDVTFLVRREPRAELSPRNRSAMSKLNLFKRNSTKAGLGGLTTDTSKAKASPVVAKAEASPVAAKAEASPVAAKAEASPVAAKAEASPEAAKAEASPVAAKAEASPEAAKADASPVAAKAEASPVAATSEASPVAAKAEASPVAAKAEASPVAAKAEASPMPQTAAAAASPTVKAANEAANEAVIAKASADATAEITLLLKRKNGQFGIGVRDDNCVLEVDTGSGSHEAGFRPGDWIVSIGGVSVDDVPMKERYTATRPLLKAIKDVPTPVIVRYNPHEHPDRVKPPAAVASPRTVPVPAPAPAPARAHSSLLPVGEATAAPTLTATQIAEGVRVVSISKPDASARLGITLTSDHDSPLSERQGSGILHISKLAPDALGAASGGLEVGDAVLAVNGVPVVSHSDASAMVKKTTGIVHLTIKRDPAPTTAPTPASTPAPAPAPAPTPMPPPGAKATSSAPTSAPSSPGKNAAATSAPSSPGNKAAAPAAAKLLANGESTPIKNFFGGIATGIASIGKSATGLVMDPLGKSAASENQDPLGTAADAVRDAFEAAAAVKLQAAGRGRKVRAAGRMESVLAAREAEAAQLWDEAARAKAVAEKLPEGERRAEAESMATTLTAAAHAAQAAVGTARDAVIAERAAREAQAEADKAAVKMQAVVRGKADRKLAGEIAEIDKDSEEAMLSALAVAKQKTAEASERRAAKAEADAEAAHRAAATLQARARGVAARSGRALEQAAAPTEQAAAPTEQAAAPTASPNGPPRKPPGPQRRDTVATLMGIMETPSDSPIPMHAAGGKGNGKEAEAASDVMLYVHKGERGTKLGLSLGNHPSDSSLVAVMDVAPGSLGAESGLVVGDVLLAVNGDAVSKHEDAREKIARAVGTLQLTLQLPRLSDCPKAQEHLMRAGHNANKAMDYYTARRHFTACHELGGRVEALISAINMTLKLEEYQQAADQYSELLTRELEPPVMKIIERKHREAVDKLAAQSLLRAENKELGSMENLPAVAVQAFPVDEEVEDVDEGRQQQGSGLGQLLHIFSTEPNKTSQSGKQSGMCCAAGRPKPMVQVKPETRRA